MVRLNSWGQANAFKIEDFVNAYTLTGEYLSKYQNIEKTTYS